MCKRIRCVRIDAVKIFTWYIYIYPGFYRIVQFPPKLVVNEYKFLLIIKKSVFNSIQFQISVLISHYFDKYYHSSWELYLPEFNSGHLCFALLKCYVFYNAITSPVINVQVDQVKVCSRANFTSCCRTNT